MTDEIPGAAPLETVPVSVPPAPPKRSLLYRIFVGPRGVRAGWKDLIFFLLMALIAVCLHPLGRLHGKVNPKEPMPARAVLFDEFSGALAVVIATAIMAKWIDRKPWGYFGMPLRNAFRSSFWIGSAIGLGALSLQLEIMHLAGWFDFGTIDLHGAAIVEYGAVWALMFFFTGVTEEGLLRGYVQRVTTDGLSRLPGGWSFWVSALIFSVMFGAGHLGNPGENKFGIFMVFVDGMTMCFSLWCTGDLWFAIGNHAAWDWGQSFLFGTPDSGVYFQHALMHPSFHGPLLLSGGTDGPEGSVLVLLSEAIFVLLIAVIYRRRRFSLITDALPAQSLVNTQVTGAMPGE
jgi:membrane protease YdiL (CAAX protease family)